MAYRLTEAAGDQIDAVLLESARTHGDDAAIRYALLIFATVAALGENPGLAGSSEVPRLAGVRAYPMRFSRPRVEPSLRVRKPRHLLVYRIDSDGVAVILGLAHDRMMLSRAARRIARSADLP